MTASPAAPAGTATIVVHRPLAWVDGVRRYRVQVGSQVVRLRAGKEVSVDVPAGPVTVSARIDWSAPAQWSREVAGGETVHLVVEHGSVWRGLVGAGPYLVLREVTPPSPGR